MPYVVDFENVSAVGLESSPVAPALAGLRANEARYFKNKYDHVFTVEPAAKAKKTIDWVHRTLKEERDIRHHVATAGGDDHPGRKTSDGPTCSTRTGSRSTSPTRSTTRRSERL